MHLRDIGNITGMHAVSAIPGCRSEAYLALIKLGTTQHGLRRYTLYSDIGRCICVVFKVKRLYIYYD